MKTWKLYAQKGWCLYVKQEGRHSPASVEALMVGPVPQRIVVKCKGEVVASCVQFHKIDLAAQEPVTQSSSASTHPVPTRHKFSNHQVILLLQLYR